MEYVKVVFTLSISTPRPLDTPPDPRYTSPITSFEANTMSLSDPRPTTNVEEQAPDLLAELLSMAADSLEESEKLSIDDLMDGNLDLLREETGSPVVVGHGGDRWLPALSLGLQKVSHRHRAIMDFMIAHPTLPMSEVAAHFGYTPAWLSTVINSDVFRHAFKERRANWEAIHDHKLAAKLHEVANKSLDCLTDILTDEENRPSPTAANEIAKTALSALGFIGRKAEAQAPAVQVNQQFITSQDLKDAQAILHGTRN